MGRDEEFTDFVVATWPTLVRTSRLLAHDPSGAEDLVQTALIKTYARWRSVDDPLAYTRTVVARLAVRAGKRKWLGEIPTDTMPDQVAQQVESSVESAIALRSVLNSLAPAQRAVLILRFYCDFTELQVSEALGCSRGTVRSRTQRALAALRALPETRMLETIDDK